VLCSALCSVSPHFLERVFREYQCASSFTISHILSCFLVFAAGHVYHNISSEYLQSKIESGKFQRSYVDQVDAASSGKSTFDTQHRTSTFLSFSKRQDSRTAAIEHRAADLLGCWTSQSVEPLQLVKYLKGQFFGVHHDMGDLDDDGCVALPQKCPYSKRRLITIFCYMNAVDAGGSTYFPACGDLRVEPRPGRAVLFANVKSDGLPDPRTIHAGEPVEKGIKYGLNIWLCEE
jgi:prolyl 4-hydroxylase